MTTPDKVTTAIHARGWTVWDACEFWGVEYSNFRRKVRRVLGGGSKNEKALEQLMCMCSGLESKNE